MVTRKMKNIASISFFRRMACALTLCIIVWILLTMTSMEFNTSQNSLEYDVTNVECYTQDLENNIPEISEDDTGELKGKGIFFHETTCFSNRNESLLTPRQGCAVESAALTHPNHTVFLLYTAPIKSLDQSAIYKELIKYPNIKVRRVNLNSYMLNTPLEEWYKTDPLRKTNYAITHTSDVLRYVTLWKYGGIYMDLDVVVLKNMDDLESNYAGAESNNDIAAGVIKLDNSGRGYEVAEAFLSDLKCNFNGYIWGNNGPGVITRVLQKLCGTKNTEIMNRITCEGFKVYEKRLFYPIGFDKWKWFMQENDLENAMYMIKDAYVMHMWNKVSYKLKIPKETRAAYTVVAEKQCPGVLNNWDGDF